jgi:tRNA pseudouridine38-40 synthase
MREAAEILRGTHDFTSFSSTEMDTPSRVRDLTVCEIERVGDQIVFALSANAFLHSMVRIIVGTLTEVGQGRRSVEDVQKILEAKDRRLAGRTAPPQGLVLVEVIY